MCYPHIRTSHALSVLALVATLCNPQDATAATDPRLPPPRVTLAGPTVAIEPATGRLAAVLILDAPAAASGRVGWVLERSATGHPRAVARGSVRFARGATRLRFDLPVDASRLADTSESLRLRLASATGLRLGDALTAAVNLDQPSDLELEPTLVTTGRFPRLATDDDGSATLIWERDGVLEGARYGDRRATGAFEIARPTGGAGSVVTDWGAAAVLTAGPDGDVLVAWRGRDHAGLDHPTQLFLRFVEADDLSVGPLIAASGVDTTMEIPVVAADPGGDAWAVAWSTVVTPTFPPSVRTYARVLSRQGAPRGAVLELTVTPAFYVGVTSLTAIGGGRFVVTWAEGGRLSVPAFYQQVFDAEGQKIGERRRLDGRSSDVLAEQGGGFARYSLQIPNTTSFYAIDQFDHDGNPVGERVTFPYGAGCDGPVSSPGEDEMLCLSRQSRSIPNTGQILGARRFARVGAAADTVPFEYAVTGCNTLPNLGCDPGGSTSVAAADLRPARNGPPGARIGWVLAYDTPAGIVAQRVAPVTSSFVRFDTPDPIHLAPGFTRRIDVIRSGPADGEARVRIRSLAGNGAGLAHPIDQVLVWPPGDTSPRHVQMTAPSTPGTTFSLGLFEAGGDAQVGSPSSIQVQVASAGTCVPDGLTLCLDGGRFAARVWFTQPDQSGGSYSTYASPAPYSDFTGFFWFDDPRNLELAVKILDFGVGGIHVYYAQLTDFHFELAITDLATGRSKTYVNDNPNPCGGIDGDFDGILGASASPAPTVASAKSTCSPGGDSALCLLDGRYEVTSSWRNQYDGSAGLSRARQLSDFTGLFTFGDPRNVEVLTKVLDFGDHRILFMGGSLSDLDYRVTATELSTGSEVGFANHPGAYCGWRFDSYF
jgi:hypothetical protein